MPIQDGKYISPDWQNNTEPAIDAGEMNDISKTLETCDANYSRQEILTEETADKYDLGENIVPDNLFGYIADFINLIKNNYASVTVTVKTSDGILAQNVEVNNVIDNEGKTVFTNSSGVASGYATQGSKTFTVSNKYFDISSTSVTQNIERGKSYNFDLTVTKKSGTISILSSGTYVLSGITPLATIDVCAVGGGGGGSYAGGGGGFASNKLSVEMTTSDSLKITIGAGGGISNKQAGSGGITSVYKNNSLLVSANGGNGANSTTAGTGNGNGGIGYSGSTPGRNGTSASTYMFNDTGLGLAGGGGGGGNNASFNNPTAGGPPYGGRGATRNSGSPIPASNPTGPGGAGAGGSSVESGDYRPSSGYSGAVYIRIKEAA